MKFDVRHTVRVANLCILFLGSASWAGATQDDWGAPQVKVSQDAGKWVVQGAKNRLELDPTNLEMSVHTQNRTWSMAPSFAGDLVVEVSGKMYSLRLADAQTHEASSYQTGFKTGLKIGLSGFRQQETAIDLSLSLFACLEGQQEELVCELIAAEDEARVLECFWPGAPVDSSFDVTVVPFMQGMFLPKDWPKKVWLYDPVCYGRGLYMPWWGHQKEDSAMCVLIETPNDAGCRFDHPAGGPTKMQLRWMHSLGKLQYPRRVRYCFFDKGNYVSMAKRYRRHVVETGHFVSLREKIARNPLVEKLVGSPVVHTGILSHIQPESQYYNKENAAANHQWTSFDERARQLRDLAGKGIDRVYVHLDGWGFRGYDNLHPDVLPPCPEAGGWDGMKRLADTCDELGYVFAIHDQYRDYYLDAKSYDPRHTILDRAGQRPTHSIWYGGKQSILCSRLALGHVKKNYLGLLNHGIKLRGAYLDVFAVVSPDECYNPEHPATRADCIQYRGMCMDFVRSMGGVVSSEEPADWAIPHIDLVHHGPYAQTPGPGSGPAMGIPVPLFNLVYHDALLLPWSMTKGGWGIPDNDLGYLHALANAGMPYLSLQPGDEELKQVRTVCGLHRRVALLEMTNHEFLDESFRTQRTTFSDGTTVTIDLDQDRFVIASPSASSDDNRTMRYTSRPAEQAKTWQDTVRAKLWAAMKIDDLLRDRSGIALAPKKLSAVNKGSYSVEDVEISSTADRCIRIVVTLPAAQGKSAPAVVCIGGHGSDLYSPYNEQTIYRGFGDALADKGYVTISTTVSQHEVYEKDRLLMGERLWDLMRCVDYLESLPRVDRSRIGCAGLSLGGEMAMWLGAMDERIAATVSAGFLTTMDHMEHNHCMCWKFDGLRELVDYADIYSLIAPRPLQCQNGLQEPPSQFYVPPAREAMEEVRIAYKDLGRPENVVLDVHAEGHVIDLPALLYFFDKHLAVARKKIVFLPGPQSHGWSGHAYTADCKLLAQILNENVPTIEATVVEGGWPKDTTVLDDSAAIVIACDGNGLLGPESNWKALDGLVKKGVGVAFLHYALDPGTQCGKYLLDWIGGYYEQHWSVNPSWLAQFKTLPQHPITRGVQPFKVDDEWYYHMRFRQDMQGVTPILTAVPPDGTRKGPDGPHSGNPTVRARLGMSEHVAWACERPDGGRGFGCTGGHTHWVYANNDFRRLMLNAMCWIARTDVPADGVLTRTPTVEQMEANLEGDREQNWTPERTRQIIERMNQSR
ncbi:MAG: ThuA domain-containing protein [Sedimentisphaerales bacterium]|nr:ThuA domain-containing protein [Sedimentisphaerales bacterium]